MKRQIRKAILAARDLMNEGGRHWVKLSYRTYDENDEARYCLVGGLRQSFQGDALGEYSRLDEDQAEPYHRGLVAVATAIGRSHIRRRNYSTRGYSLVPLRDATADELEGLLVDFNDKAGRGWKGVEGALIAAADSLK